MSARWDEGRWDEGRWAGLAPSDLLLQPPISGGRPTGQGDWNLIVEILLPEIDSGLWGIATWGDFDWGSLAWQDITDRVRGQEWTRGSDEVFGRPRVGRIALSLDNRDGLLDPWTAPSAQFLAPGTLLRCGLISTTGIVDPLYGTIRWLPQWTGIVETWAPQMSDSDYRDRWVEVALNETVRDLAQVDDPALTSAVGSGEGAAVRTERLLDAAGWRYGYLVEAQNLTPAPATNYPMSSTMMAQNRLAELYLVADSSDTQFRSIRDGRAASTASEYISNNGDANVEVWPGALVSWVDAAGGERQPRFLLAADDLEVSGPGSEDVYVAYRPETFRSQSQDTEISNAVTFQRVGGVEQTHRQLASIERYGQRSFVRRDLLNSTGSDSIVELLAFYVSIRRALATLRIEAVTIDTWARPLLGFLATVTVEPTQAAQIWSPIPDLPQPSIVGFIASVTHRVSPRVSGSSMLWETDIRLDTRTVYNVPGAQLPSTPL